jgi:hypothetical protein
MPRDLTERRYALAATPAPRRVSLVAAAPVWVAPGQGLFVTLLGVLIFCEFAFITWALVWRR